MRCIVEAVESANTYSEYQLILEISMTLANDHGESVLYICLAEGIYTYSNWDG